MKESTAVIQKLEAETGVNRRGGETITEYLDRVEHRLGLDEAARDRLESLSTKAQFGPDDALSEDELVAVESICGGESETDAGDSPSLSYPETDVDSPSDDEESIAALGERREGRTDSRDNDAAEHDRSLKTESRAVLGKLLSRDDVVYLFSLMAGAVFVFFYELGGYPLSTWDEGFYANLARHMVQDGYWFVPHMQYTIGLRPTSFEP